MTPDQRKHLTRGLQDRAFFDALSAYFEEKKTYALDTFRKATRPTFDEEAMVLMNAKSRVVVVLEIEADLASARKLEAD